MIKPKKSLSQNFIKDKNICRKIVSEANINDRLVIEIGAGYGFLTDFILEKKPKKLYLIEKDNELSKKLRIKYKKNKNIEIINKDVLKIKFYEFNNCNIISNLPYNVSTKIILYLFNFNKNIDEMILMLQKEVAYKFDYNQPKMNKYKFLTKLSSIYRRCFNVPSTVFIPKPKVESTVVKFNINSKNINLEKANNFCDIIFKNKRKKISNKINIKNLVNRNSIINKRIDEISLNDLISIYNSI